jgi:hypothetical protein
MKCPSGWMDDETSLGEASFTIYDFLTLQIPLKEGTGVKERMTFRITLI